tara:strand:+ start:526 stop:870 length:345 start_codon:yes stop_codon:yes gene_type:complete
MILEILRAIVGILFGLFIPGFLLSLILFKKIDILERIALAIGLSIAIDVLVGLFLGANKTMKEITGGITELNVWLYLVFISVVLALIYVLRLPKKRTHQKIINKKDKLNKNATK